MPMFGYVWIIVGVLFGTLNLLIGSLKYELGGLGVEGHLDRSLDPSALAHFQAALLFFVTAAVPIYIVSRSRIKKNMLIKRDKKTPSSGDGIRS